MPVSKCEKSRCRRCGKSVIWLRHAKSGRLAPLDEMPREGGDFAANLETGNYEISPSSDEKRYTKHAETCPFRDSARPGAI